MSEVSSIKVLGVDLEVKLKIVNNSLGIIICASSNIKDFDVCDFISNKLNEYGFSTLIVNLYTNRENNENTFKYIQLFTDRLVGVTKWVIENDKLNYLPIGYVGINGSAASVVSASAYWGSSKIKSVVTINGRPDLASDVLDLVESPTLLIVSTEGKEIVDNNRQAYIHLGCEKKTEFIQGKIDINNNLIEVSGLLSKWFSRHFV